MILNEINTIKYKAIRQNIPISGVLMINRNCNHNCGFCYSPDRDNKNILSLDQIQDLVEDFNILGTLAVSITGGEPFLHPDILEILDLLNKNNIFFRINTNGSKIDREICRFLSKMEYLSSVYISLYSAENEIHDSITGSRGSFFRTLNNIKRLKDAGIPLQINTLRLKENQNELNDLEKLARTLKVPFKIRTSLYPRDDGDPAPLLYSPESEYDKKNFELPKEISEMNIPVCMAGYSFFSITSSGEVFPCLKMQRLMEKPLGNIKENPFSYIWYNNFPVFETSGLFEEQELRFSDDTLLLKDLSINELISPSTLRCSDMCGMQRADYDSFCQSYL